MDLKSIDKGISELSAEIDLYSFLTPLNREEERARFFDAVSGGREYNPVFTYRQPSRSGPEPEIQGMLKVLKGARGAGSLLLGKAEHLLAEVSLLSADDKAYGEKAVKLHGMPDRETTDKSLEILENSREEKDVFPEETVSPEEMADTVRNVLAEKRVEWTVRISPKIVPKITVSGRDRTIYINAAVFYTPQEVERLKVHEVEVHIFRGANGSLQPYRILAEGTAGYDATEEGLAIIAEEITGCLEVDTRQMKLYAGRALAASLALERPFFGVFKALLRYFPEEIAYRITERVKRGMKDTSRKGGLTKDQNYIRGWLEMKKFTGSGGDIGKLYAGKIGTGDLDIVTGMMERGELVPPKYLPEFAENK